MRPEISKKFLEPVRLSSAGQLFISQKQSKITRLQYISVLRVKKCCSKFNFNWISYKINS